MRPDTEAGVLEVIQGKRSGRSRVVYSSVVVDVLWAVPRSQPAAHNLTHGCGGTGKKQLMPHILPVSAQYRLTGSCNAFKYRSACVPGVEGYQPRSALPPAPCIASSLLCRGTVQDAMVVGGVYHATPARQQHQLVLEVPEVCPHKVGVSADL